jgi:hypothetical protein
MIAFPIAASNKSDKMAYAYRVTERLRLWHNEQGAKVLTGELTPEAFRSWVRNEWQPRQKATYQSLHQVDGFDQLVPHEYHNALKKAANEDSLSTVDELAMQVISDRHGVRAGGKQDASWDTFIDLDKLPKLNVLGEPPDPVENYTTYTEVDPSSILAILSATSVELNASTTLNQNAYIYKDLGVNYFSGNFEHTFAHNLRVKNTGHWEVCFPWQLKNVIENTFITFNSPWTSMFGHMQYFHPTVDDQMNDVFEVVAGVGTYADAWSTNSKTGILYYFTITRDLGVGPYGTLYSDMFSDSGRTTLVDSSVVTLHVGTKYRYFYPISTMAGGSCFAGNGLVQNSDISNTSIPWYIALKRFDTASGTWKKQKIFNASGFGSGNFEHNKLKMFNAGSNEWVDVDVSQSE